MTHKAKYSCFPPTENERGPTPTVEAGVHQYRFSFRLPDHSLPSSYEGEYGAIRYWVALQIDRHWLRFNIDRFKTITVVDHIDINAPEYCVSSSSSTAYSYIVTMAQKQCNYHYRIKHKGEGLMKVCLC